MLVEKPLSNAFTAHKLTHPLLAVSKTTKELLLAWDEGKSERSAVSVAKDLRMPQFEMTRITTNKCNSQYHMGESVQEQTGLPGGPMNWHFFIFGVS